MRERERERARLAGQDSLSQNGSNIDFNLGFSLSILCGLQGLEGEEKISAKLKNILFDFISCVKNILVAKDEIYTRRNNNKTTTTTCVSRGGPRKWKSSNDDYSLAPEVKETRNNMLWEKV